jgi:two-component system, chemotaxis family, chemotaxis protein CheY
MSTILIVDDSPTIRRMVKASLSALSASLMEAATGLQAIEALAVTRVDAVVLDLNMPDMHGLDVLRFIRSHAQYTELPVVVLTTRDDATSRESATRGGASAYLTKPFSPAVLAATVTGLLGTGRQKTSSASSSSTTS